MRRLIEEEVIRTGRNVRRGTMIGLFGMMFVILGGLAFAGWVVVMIMEHYGVVS